MPSGPRIRANNVFGVTTDNPLTIGATIFNSPSLFLLPVVSSAHAIIVLDPKRVYGEPEIVSVTTHTALATSATITRGVYGTTTRAHPVGTAWAQVVVTDDMTPVVTSITRPTDPYRGQMIYESDTDKFIGRTQSDTWVDAVPLGVWQNWTPVITQSGTVTTTINQARYTKIGRLVVAYATLTVTGSGTGANDVVLSGLPFPGAGFVSNPFTSVGSGNIFDTSAASVYKGIATLITSTTVRFRPMNTTTSGTLGSDTFTAGLAVGDAFELHLVYEATS